MFDHLKLSRTNRNSMNRLLFIDCLRVMHWDLDGRIEEEPSDKMENEWMGKACQPPEGSQAQGAGRSECVWISILSFRRPSPELVHPYNTQHQHYFVYVCQLIFTMRFNPPEHRNCGLHLTCTRLTAGAETSFKPFLAQSSLHTDPCNLCTLAAFI